MSNNILPRVRNFLRAQKLIGPTINAKELFAFVAEFADVSNVVKECKSRGWMSGPHRDCLPDPRPITGIVADALQGIVRKSVVGDPYFRLLPGLDESDDSGEKSLQWSESETIRKLAQRFKVKERTIRRWAKLGDRAPVPVRQYPARGQWQYMKPDE